MNIPAESKKGFYLAAGVVAFFLALGIAERVYRRTMG